MFRDTFQPRREHGRDAREVNARASGLRSEAAAVAGAVHVQCHVHVVMDRTER